MSLDAWKLWVDIGQFALTGLVAFFVWLTRQSQVNRDAITRLSVALDERLDRVESRVLEADVSLRAVPTTTQCLEHVRRISQVEETLRHIPGHEDMKRVHARIDAVTELVSEVRGRLGGIERMLDMISQHLIDQSAPKREGK